MATPKSPAISLCEAVAGRVSGNKHLLFFCVQAGGPAAKSKLICGFCFLSVIFSHSWHFLQGLGPKTQTDGMLFFVSRGLATKQTSSSGKKRGIIIFF